ncbi:MAG: hypothetical protein US25_C0045G0005 [Candidatus Moranbacteria bacterium GW2011_GWE1_36_7]|nr:MAG: hypothetical protein UR99_C0004G0005 [Candidatus Moranbacteria bacterium GW2011_GWD2_36_12]KKQ06915.1 MAG: hypothetical protein US16_C0006G0005 [Candidatus Moranbacteria bacterium GW2011_GWE2_36_40]KKQ12755.1 MAG: hypothetical protein US25_C0045G0005 [Candidatus Moranbacteria bacterium GW2011_GWE1_36_7]
MNKKNVFIAIILFVAVGFFLRSYNFSEWLRFNADQARDARLAINVSEGREPIPLLGPWAGGTSFKLGGVFYYFQIASVKIFGSHPQVAAYPDLLFAILSIPLLFLFAKIFFNSRISLMVVWLYVISYFAVKYSRFAWNPNSTPFFVMLYLYSLHGLMGSEKSKKILWAILCGIALGISMQLHTSLLIILPVVSIVAATILFKKKQIGFSIMAIILAAALFVNTAQIISEIKTGGVNSLQLILGATEKNQRNASFGENLLLNISCHIKSNGHIISALGDEEECGYRGDIKTVNKLDGKRMTIFEKVSFVAVWIFFAIFSFGGYFLLGRSAKKEKEQKKKDMLIILSVYVGISFLFFVAWATELSVRFFLGLSFIPFFLAGFWVSFLSKKFRKEILVILIAVLVLSFFNFQKIYGTFKDLKNGGREINGDFDYATLGEENFIVEFLQNNSQDQKTLVLDAQAGYLFKMLRPLQFLSEKYALNLIELREEVKLESGDNIFYIKSADTGCDLPAKTLKKYEIEKCVSHGQFSIFSLRVK